MADKRPWHPVFNAPSPEIVIPAEAGIQSSLFTAADALELNPARNDNGGVVSTSDGLTALEAVAPGFWLSPE
jgi:hypothetical protein